MIRPKLAPLESFRSELAVVEGHFTAGPNGIAQVLENRDIDGIGFDRAERYCGVEVAPGNGEFALEIFYQLRTSESKRFLERCAMVLRQNLLRDEKRNDLGL